MRLIHTPICSQSLFLSVMYLLSEKLVLSQLPAVLEAFIHCTLCIASPIASPISPGEVLLPLYLRHGPSFVRHLDGEFALTVSLARYFAQLHGQILLTALPCFQHYFQPYYFERIPRVTRIIRALWQLSLVLQPAGSSVRARELTPALPSYVKLSRCIRSCIRTWCRQMNRSLLSLGAFPTSAWDLIGSPLL